MRILGIIASSIFKVFTDNFNRSTTAPSLGTPSGGGVWNILRGSWNANGSVGVGNSDPATYPIVSTDVYTTSPTISLDLPASYGSGASFWVQDANNWWAVVPWQATNTTYGSACGAYGQSCTSYYALSVCQNYGAQYNSRYKKTSYYCGGYVYGGQGCNAYTSACTSYYQTSATSAGSSYLRLLRSVSGTVSTVVDSIIAATPFSIRVAVTSGGTITAKAFTGFGQVTQTGGDLVNTPASPTKATKHGMIVSPGGWSQGTSFDNITIRQT
jgi:hypothetical protein